MAINKNHEVEDLDGVKCAIVEKNASPDRVAFLKDLLTFNGYSIVVVKSPPPKVVPPVVVPAEGETPQAAPPVPETFTIGVTDVTFNPINAIFGRLLHTPEGHVVTLAYWNQKEKEAHDEIPYFENV